MTIQDIQALVATRFGVTRLDLISDRRSKAIYRPRQAAMWLCSRLTTHSWLPSGGSSACATTPPSATP